MLQSEPGRAQEPSPLVLFAEVLNRFAERGDRQWSPFNWMAT